MTLNFTRKFKCSTKLLTTTHVTVSLLLLLLVFIAETVQLAMHNVRIEQLYSSSTDGLDLTCRLVLLNDYRLNFYGAFALLQHTHVSPASTQYVDIMAWETISSHRVFLLLQNMQIYRRRCIFLEPPPPLPAWVTKEEGCNATTTSGVDNVNGSDE